MDETNPSSELTGAECSRLLREAVTGAQEVRQRFSAMQTRYHLLARHFAPLFSSEGYGVIGIDANPDPFTPPDMPDAVHRDHARVQILAVLARIGGGA